MADQGISVVVPTFNRRHSVIAALDSIAEAAEGLDVEVVVSDNASTDGSAALVRSWSHLHPDLPLTLLEADLNCGPVPNWIKGIGASEGKYCKVLWSDDRLESTSLKKLMAALESDERVRVATCGARVVGPRETLITTLYTDYSGPYTLGEALRWRARGYPLLPLSPSAALVHRSDAVEALNEVNPESEAFRTAVGPDLLINLWGLTGDGSGVHLSEPLVLFGANAFDDEEESITLTTPKLLRRSLYDQTLLGALSLGSNEHLEAIEGTLRHRVWESGIMGSRLEDESWAKFRPSALPTTAAWWFNQSKLGRRIRNLYLR